MFFVSSTLTVCLRWCLISPSCKIHLILVPVCQYCSLLFCGTSCLFCQYSWTARMDCEVMKFADISVTIDASVQHDVQLLAWYEIQYIRCLLSVQYLTFPFTEFSVKKILFCVGWIFIFIFLCCVWYNYAASLSVMFVYLFPWGNFFFLLGGEVIPKLNKFVWH